MGGDLRLSEVPDIAVILTVYNRPLDVLKRTLATLLLPSRAKLQLVVVDDGSDEEHRAAYAPLREELCQKLGAQWRETSTIEKRPETYHIDGHNNPAYVNNVAIDMAALSGARRTLFLSSDTMVGDGAIDRAFSHPEDTVVIARTVDSLRGTVFCQSSQVWPMCWFVLAPTSSAVRVRFDEEYLKGMAFEDNDFQGRLFLDVGRMVVDDSVGCLHQAHLPIAYSDGWRGFRRSETYTRKKWGGIPFRPRDGCLTYYLEKRQGVAVLTEPSAPKLGTEARG